MIRKKIKISESCNNHDIHQGIVIPERIAVYDLKRGSFKHLYLLIKHLSEADILRVKTTIAVSNNQGNAGQH